MTKRVTPTLAICLLVAGIAVFGLGRSGTNNSPANETAGQPAPAAATGADATSSVTIEGFAFSGTTVAQPGATLTVENLDGAPHTLTARDGSFDTGIIQAGASGSLTLPTQPGSYDYFCSLHPSMTARIDIDA